MNGTPDPRLAITRDEYRKLGVICSRHGTGWLVFAELLVFVDAAKQRGSAIERDIVTLLLDDRLIPSIRDGELCFIHVQSRAAVRA